MFNSALINLPSGLYNSPFVYTFQYGIVDDGLISLPRDIEQAYSFRDSIEFVSTGVALKSMFLRHSYCENYRLNESMTKLIDCARSEPEYGLEIHLWLFRLYCRMSPGVRFFNPGAFLQLSHDNDIGAKIVFQTRLLQQCEE